MFVATLFVIVRSILQKLGSPTLDEFRLLWGQKKQLEDLEGTIITIRNVLHDVDRRQVDDLAVQGWLTQLMLVLYQADDLFDLISTKVLQQEVKKGEEVCHVLSKPRRFAFFVENAYKVKYIRKRLDAIANDIKVFNFLSGQIEQDQPYRMQTHSYVLSNDELSSKVFGEEHRKVMQILKISYNEFPYPVKSCFAYCSLFPKNYRFEKRKLVRLWIAQGFVESSVGNRSLEDIAEEYFMYLVERFFFKDLEISTRDGVATITCQMHDIVHDLAIEVTRLESVLVDESTKKICDKTLRHISLNCKSESYVDIVCTSPHVESLRSFLCLDKFHVEKRTLNKLMSCKVLRSLDLSGLEIKEIPSSIGSLIHLRLLDLSYNPMESLPSSICNLHNLQSLILKGCGTLKELPNDLGKLVRLRHLLLEDYFQLRNMPPGLADLTSLVTLDTLIVDDIRGGLRYLEHLDNLSGYMKIVIPRNGWENATFDAEKSCLSRKNRLDALNIVFLLSDPSKCGLGWKSATLDVFIEVDTLMNALQPHDNLKYLSIYGYGVKKFPSWITCLRDLVKLEIESCERCVELVQLSHLKSLKKLIVSEMPSLLTIEGSVSYDSESFFPSLETLCIRYMPNLRSWWLEAPTVVPSFPRATKVEISNCRELTKSMPLFPLVEDLNLFNVREEVMWHSLAFDGKSSLKAFRGFSIRGLCRITKAQIRHLSSLQNLTIANCEELETLSCIDLECLTSLEELTIRSWKLKWVETGHLPRVRKLEIPNVKRYLFNSLEYMSCLEDLYLNCFDEELQSESINTNEGMPWKSLQKLQQMVLWFGTQFSMARNQSLLKGFEHLTSLRELTLRNCDELYLSWRALLSLPYLESLRIYYVEKVIEVDDSSTMISQTQLISNLFRRLVIGSDTTKWSHDIPWKSFPFLRYLELYHISEMEALPDGIQHLTSLQELDIHHCTRLISLPSWMSSLSFLRRLRIWGSSDELKKRCERLTGEDWPNIHHIPDISIS